MKDKIRLNKVANIVMGQSPDSSSCNDFGLGIPFLQGSGDFGDKHPVIKNYCLLPKKIAPKESILISVRAPVGDINLAHKKLVIGRGLAGIIPKEIDRDFLFYSIDLFKTQLKRLAQGTTFEAINSIDLQNFEINYFHPTNQQKIAKILNTIDAVIEKTEDAIGKYQAIKKGMMHDLFMRGIDVKTGQLRPSFKDAPELYKESALGMIPKDWGDLIFSDISVVNQGLQIAIEQRFSEEGLNRYLYITIQYLNNPQSAHYKYFVKNPPQSVICEKDDVLMVRTGNTGMVVTDIKGVFHNNFFNIKYSKEINKDYLVHYLKRNEIQQLILNYAGTTTIPDLKHGDFYKLPFLKPDLKEQILISKRLNQIDSLINKEQKILAKHQKIKKGLMQDLLTGKVEVSV
ncbi:restriction endonuclease subunit S [Cellulophaga lytica]|nr:restriction endonuclease subunit S [Cellulophaga lytica]